LISGKGISRSEGHPTRYPEIRVVRGLKKKKKKQEYIDKLPRGGPVQR